MISYSRRLFHPLYTCCSKTSHPPACQSGYRKLSPVNKYFSSFLLKNVQMALLAQWGCGRWVFSVISLSPGRPWSVETTTLRSELFPSLKSLSSHGSDKLTGRKEDGFGWGRAVPQRTGGKASDTTDSDRRHYLKWKVSERGWSGKSSIKIKECMIKFLYPEKL